MAGLQSDRRIARAEPRFVEVVRFGGQRRPSRSRAWAISSVVDSRREMSPFMELISSAMRASRSAICASRSARAIFVDSAVSSFAATRPSRQLQREALDARPEGVELGLERKLRGEAMGAPAATAALRPPSGEGAAAPQLKIRATGIGKISALSKVTAR